MCFCFFSPCVGSWFSYREQKFVHYNRRCCHPLMYSWPQLNPHEKIPCSTVKTLGHKLLGSLHLNTGSLALIWLERYSSHIHGLCFNPENCMRAAWAPWCSYVYIHCISRVPKNLCCGQSYLSYQIFHFTRKSASLHQESWFGFLPSGREVKANTVNSTRHKRAKVTQLKTKRKNEKNRTSQFPRKKFLRKFVVLTRGEKLWMSSRQNCSKPVKGAGYSSHKYRCPLRTVDMTGKERKPHPGSCILLLHVWPPIPSEEKCH